MGLVLSNSLIKVIIALMTKATLDKEIQSITKLIIHQIKPYKPQKVILFGSYARGSASKDSDVDLVLIKNTNDNFQTRLKKVRLLISTTTPVDVFVFTPKEFKEGTKTNPLLSEIERAGKIIYG